MADGPTSLFARAQWVCSLNDARLLSLVATRDVSSIVRARAATHELLPKNVAVQCARDRAARVRKAAYSVLKGKQLAKALRLESHANVLACALQGATELDSKVATEFIEHDHHGVRAAAVRFADKMAVRALLDDGVKIVRKAARDALMHLELNQRDVIRIIHSGDDVCCLADFRLHSLPAFATAVAALQREERASGNEARVRDALVSLVSSHDAFTRTFDFARAPADRLRSEYAHT